MRSRSKTAAARALLLALLDFDARTGAYGRQLMAATSLPGGTVYPLLQRLEEDGLLESTDEGVDPTVVKRPARTYWRFTALGAVAAREERIALTRARTALGLAVNPLWQGP